MVNGSRLRRHLVWDSRCFVVSFSIELCTRSTGDSVGGSSRHGFCRCCFCGCSGVHSSGGFGDSRRIWHGVKPLPWGYQNAPIAFIAASATITAASCELSLIISKLRCLVSFGVAVRVIGTVVATAAAVLVLLLPVVVVYQVVRAQHRFGAKRTRRRGGRRRSTESLLFPRLGPRGGRFRQAPQHKRGPHARAGARDGSSRRRRRRGRRHCC
mmetsp:Transcript_13389/g.26406  ORF Transcript_13389/g.26406 Transcript_13389/m.26406 type:complete len:212 (-) Transcript_13389:760-1395(-)